MLDFIFDFFNQYQDLFLWVGIGSAILFVLGAIATPYLIGLLPEDYFIKQKNYQFQIRSFLHGLGIVIRTTLGLILFIAGVIMLVTPGQGLLSIVLGLSLMEFPGKHKLEYQLVSHDPTFKALNWLRAKAGKAPFQR